MGGPPGSSVALSAATLPGHSPLAPFAAWRSATTYGVSGITDAASRGASGGLLRTPYHARCAVLAATMTAAATNHERRMRGILPRPARRRAATRSPARSMPRPPSTTTPKPRYMASRPYGR
ncbi:MAG: hypothetical protein H6513_06325 [Acidimicrobiaceae bacterium]|nr:hypothetical protein [Acidimicrobiaceae bacterium]